MSTSLYNLKIDYDMSESPSPAVAEIFILNINKRTFTQGSHEPEFYLCLISSKTVFTPIQKNGLFVFVPSAEAYMSNISV